MKAVTSKQADPIHQCTDSLLSEILGKLKVDAQHMSLKQCPGLHLWKIMVLGAVICPVHCASCQMDIPTEMLMCHPFKTPHPHLGGWPELPSDLSDASHPFQVAHWHPKLRNPASRETAERHLVTT